MFSSLGHNASLMLPEVRGEGLDCFELVGSYDPETVIQRFQYLDFKFSLCVILSLLWICGCCGP